MLAWTSLPGYRTYLGSYFSEFLLQAGIDHPRLVDRFLVICQYGGIRPILCLNKCDLVDPVGT